MLRRFKVRGLTADGKWVALANIPARAVGKNRREVERFRRDALAIAEQCFSQDVSAQLRLRGTVINIKTFSAIRVTVTNALGF
jgi:hypothetical protein